jgi:hypothetical protein
VNALVKSPSRRVAVIAGTIAVLMPAMTPAAAASPREKLHVTKKQQVERRPTGGGSGPVSLERMITAALRP